MTTSVSSRWISEPCFPASRTASSEFCASITVYPCSESTMWASPRTAGSSSTRSEEHTSELQSRLHLVCRLLLEKKKIYLSSDAHPVIYHSLPTLLLATTRAAYTL